MAVDFQKRPSEVMFTDVEGRLSNDQHPRITLHQLRIPDIQFFRSREIAASCGKVVRA